MQSFIYSFNHSSNHLFILGVLTFFFFLPFPPFPCTYPFIFLPLRPLPLGTHVVPMSCMWNITLTNELPDSGLRQIQPGSEPYSQKTLRFPQIKLHFNPCPYEAFSVTACNTSSERPLPWIFYYKRPIPLRLLPMYSYGSPLSIDT